MHFVQLLQCTYVQLTFKLTIEDDVRLHFMSKFFSAFKWVSELFLDYKTIWLQGCKLSALNMYFHIEKKMCIDHILGKWIIIIIGSLSNYFRSIWTLLITWSSLWCNKYQVIQERVISILRDHIKHTDT